LIILDASAVIEFLLRANSVPTLSHAIAESEIIACPMILDFEILNTLRRQVQEKIVTLERAEQAMVIYNDLPLERYNTFLLSDKIWQLRNNFTAYDASYIALSELLAVPLYTKDRKWMGKPGHSANIYYL
jgi:predicted nucleic acid-binding protein